jgi:GMC oxidoreductase
MKEHLTKSITIALLADRAPLAADFAERVPFNQWKLGSELKPHYDFIVYGSGSSRSVVTRRLAEIANVSVLLLEAGGDDDIPSVMEAGQPRSRSAISRYESDQGLA